jgi:hypothetical protein
MHALNGDTNYTSINSTNWKKKILYIKFSVGDYFILYAQFLFEET